MRITWNLVLYILLGPRGVASVGSKCNTGIATSYMQNKQKSEWRVIASEAKAFYDYELTQIILIHRINAIVEVACVKS